jgi:predicted esterase
MPRRRSRSTYREVIPARLALLLVLASTSARGAWGVAYPPADVTAPRPAIVYLHGMWASPEDSCAHFARAAAPFGFLVCPRGNAPFGDGNMWSGTPADAERQIHAALAAAERLAPGKLDLAGGGTLIGYSNGAYFAAAVARAEPGRWTGLVLLSMKLRLDPAQLRAAGIRRVVLAAGERDPAAPSMTALAARLESGGLEARFMSLGPGGHPFPPDIADRMCDAVSWVRAATP